MRIAGLPWLLVLASLATIGAAPAGEESKNNTPAKAFPPRSGDPAAAPPRDEKKNVGGYIGVPDRAEPSRKPFGPPDDRGRNDLPSIMPGASHRSSSAPNTLHHYDLPTKPLKGGLKKKEGKPKQGGRPKVAFDGLGPEGKEPGERESDGKGMRRDRRRQDPPELSGHLSKTAPGQMTKDQKWTPTPPRQGGNQPIAAEESGRPPSPDSGEETESDTEFDDGGLTLTRTASMGDGMLQLN